jgi:hypothetical protein
MPRQGGAILIGLGLLLTSCSKEEPATQTPSAVAGLAKMGSLAVDPFAQMALAFEGNPSPDEIRAKIDPVLKMYGVELTNANFSLAGKTLTTLRKEQGHSEMAILEKMLEAPTNGEKFDDAARRVSTSMN